MSLRRSIRARVARLLPRPPAEAESPVLPGVRRHETELLLARRGTHPTYGTSYEQEMLPPGLTPEQLREYVSRMGWYHQIDLGNGVLTPG